MGRCVLLELTACVRRVAGRAKKNLGRLVEDRVDCGVLVPATGIIPVCSLLQWVLGPSHNAGSKDVVGLYTKMFLLIGGNRPALWALVKGVHELPLLHHFELYSI